MKVASKSVLVTAGLAVVGIGGTYFFSSILPIDTEHATWLPVFATLLIVGVTYYTSQFTYRMADHFGETREGEFRPYVSIDLEKKGNQVYLVCSSFGRGVAADVAMRLTKPAAGPCADELNALPIFQQTFPYFAPKKEMRYPLGSGDDVLDQLPKCMEFTLSYGDYYRPDRAFTERIRLRPHLLRGLQEFT